MKPFIQKVFETFYPKSFWYIITRFFYKHNAYKHIQAQILQKLRHCLSICWASILQNFKAFIRQITKNTHNVQISPSHKHSISIFEAQKINFAKHNKAHKIFPHAYKKKTCNVSFFEPFTFSHFNFSYPLHSGLSRGGSVSWELMRQSK